MSQVFFTQEVTDWLWTWTGRGGARSLGKPSFEESKTLLATNGKIFFTETDERLWRCNADGTGATIVKVQQLSCAPNALALDENYLYYAAVGGIYRLPLEDALTGKELPGEDLLIPALGGGHNTENSIAVNSAHIYWFTEEEEGAFGEGTNYAGGISRANLDGSAINRTFRTDVHHAWGLLATDDFIYYSAVGAPVSDGIRRLATDGSGSVEPWIAPPFEGRNPGGPALATDGTHLYWTTADDVHGIGRALLNGTNVEDEWLNEEPGGRLGYTLGLAVTGGIKLGEPRFASVPL